MKRATATAIAMAMSIIATIASIFYVSTLVDGYYRSPGSNTDLRTRAIIEFSKVEFWMANRK